MIADDLRYILLSYGAVKVGYSVSACQFRRAIEADYHLLVGYVFVTQEQYRGCNGSTKSRQLYNMDQT
jgi:hypothetical protein